MTPCHHEKVKLSNVKFNQTMPVMCKKSKKELKSCWENVHENILTPCKRDKFIRGYLKS